MGRISVILTGVIVSGMIGSRGLQAIYPPLWAVGLGLTGLGVTWVYYSLTKPRSLR